MFEEQRQRRNPCLCRRPLSWCGFHVYFALEKIPPLLCDYSHRAVRLTVIYIANRILNWGQVEAYLLPHNSDLSVGGFKTAEHRSETAGSGSARLGLGHINLAEDKESEEVVTARSWIPLPLPHPNHSAPSPTVSPIFFSLCPVLSRGLWLWSIVSGDGSGDTLPTPPIAEVAGQQLPKGNHFRWASLSHKKDEKRKAVAQI